MNNKRLLKRFQSGERNFQWADLLFADLSGYNLSGINLQEADLRGANLSGANLSNANLQQANLRGANLNETNLSDADLRGANLDNVDLTSVNLDGTLIGEIPLVQEQTIPKKEINESGIDQGQQTSKNVNIIGGAVVGFFILPLLFLGLFYILAQPDVYSEDLEGLVTLLYCSAFFVAPFLGAIIGGVIGAKSK